MIATQLFLIAFNMKLQGWWQEQVKEPVLQGYTRHLLWSLLVAEENNIFPGTLRFCDSVARRENKQKVRYLRRNFDIMYWNENNLFRVTHRTKEFRVYLACQTKQRVQQQNLRVHPAYVPDAQSEQESKSEADTRNSLHQCIHKSRSPSWKTISKIGSIICWLVVDPGGTHAL